MSELNTITYNDLVSLERITFEKGKEAVANYMIDSGMVEVIDVPQGQGESFKVQEMDDDQFLTYKGEDDQAARAKFAMGYSKTITVYRVAQNIGLSYEMRTRNRYPELIQRFLNAGKKGYITMDADLSHRISFMASTSYTSRDGRTITTTTGDSLALAYSAHTLTGSSTTYRNIVANNPALSKGGLEAAEKLGVTNSYNNLGEMIAIPYDILFTSDDPNTVNTAKEILQSTADVEGAHSGITNVYRGKYRHAILPRIDTTANDIKDSDKAKYWGIASSMMKPIKLGVWEYPHSEMGLGADDSTDSIDYKVRTGYGIEVPSGRGFIASKGDGS